MEDVFHSFRGVDAGIRMLARGDDVTASEIRGSVVKMRFDGRTRIVQFFSKSDRGLTRFERQVVPEVPTMDWTSVVVYPQL